MKYQIYDKTFKTKQECYKYTSHLVNSLKNTSIYCDDEHYQYFLHLLNNHPEKETKIGCGVKGFKIAKHPTYNHYQTFIIRTNDELINFSFVCCCKFNGKYKKSQEEYLLIQAMRNSITDQIMFFKNNNKRVCCNCKTTTSAEFHVDHNEPSFQQLYHQFIKLYPCEIKKFLKDNNTRIMFDDADIEYKNKWVEFHQSNASLQILCRTCNLKKH